MPESSTASDKPRAQIVMERYWEEVNNQGKLELIRELCANPITRTTLDSTRASLGG